MGDKINKFHFYLTGYLHLSELARNKVSLCFLTLLGHQRTTKVTIENFNKIITYGGARKSDYIRLAWVSLHKTANEF